MWYSSARIMSRNKRLLILPTYFRILFNKYFLFRFKVVLLRNDFKLFIRIYLWSPLVLKRNEH